MRLLFAHPGALALGSHHGAVKSYRALAAALCGRGHDCEIVAMRPPADCGSEAWERLSSIECARGTPNRVSVAATRAVYEAASETAGVRHAMRGLRDHAEFYALLGRRIAEVAPDWVVCENGTVSTRVLRALAGPRLALSVSTTASLPFGPRSAAPSRFAASAAAYRRIRKIFCASRFIATYLREHAGIDAVVQPQVAYGRGPFETLGRFDGPVTMVNPAAHKGGAIFAALARHFPDRRFRAVESYARSVPELRTLPNVHFVSADEDVSVVLAGASLLVVPSLWGEGFGMVCIDAMLRGIPVLSSDDGGLAEATLGVGRPISVVPGRLERRWNGSLAFDAPATDPAPWRAAISELTSNRTAWSDRSERSRTAALRYVEGLSVDGLCRYLAT